MKWSSMKVIAQKDRRQTIALYGHWNVFRTRHSFYLNVLWVRSLCFFCQPLCTSLDHYVFNNIMKLITCTHSPLHFFKVFWRPPLHLKVWGGPGGSGGSEKHIWKIFYRGDPKIGTLGTPWGSHGTKIFFLKKILSKSYLGICRQVWGLLWVKSDFCPKNGYLRL